MTAGFEPIQPGRSSRPGVGPEGSQIIRVGSRRLSATNNNGNRVAGSLSCAELSPRQWNESAKNRKFLVVDFQGLATQFHLREGRSGLCRRRI